MKYHFVIPAEKYFEIDAERLEQIEEGDVCEVLLDPERKTAEYGWRRGDSDSVHVWEDDDYEGALDTVLSYFGTVWEGA